MPGPSSTRADELDTRRLKGRVYVRSASLNGSEGSPPQSQNAEPLNQLSATVPHAVEIDLGFSDPPRPFQHFGIRVGTVDLTNRRQRANRANAKSIDDHSRLAYSEILPDEKRRSCLRFFFNALRFFRGFGIRVERAMTDNGSSFRSRRYGRALRRLKIEDRSTHSTCDPQNPTARPSASSITSLREWAYARAHTTSEERAAELPIWLHRYN